MIKSLRITAPARLHVNLFDMSDHGYRQNGGVGFCVQGFDTVIEFVSSLDFKITDNRKVGLSHEEQKAFMHFLQGLYEANNYSQKICVTFLSGPPPHSGFGTGTASKLACAEAASILNHVACSQTDLITASGRGGTSGVGINTYFKGGLNVDLGVKNEGLQLGPSSSRTKVFQQPINLLNIKLPDHWSFGVIIPPDAHRISAKEEIDFFDRVCPIPATSVYESIYHAVSGMACAALEKDHSIFCASINAIQDTRWKKSEWDAQSTPVNKLKTELYAAGAQCVGLSSLGPAVYFMTSEFEKLRNKLNLSNDHVLEHCLPNNSGRELEID